MHDRIHQIILFVSAGVKFRGRDEAKSNDKQES